MKKILFIDSGSGGVNVLAHCVKKRVEGEYLYFGDTLFSPYGDKSKKELQKRVVEILELTKVFFDFEIVVFACNTLTTSTIDFVREQYPNIVFVGTVPAIKPAFEKYEKDEVLFMATKRTIENLKIDGLTVKDLPKLVDENLLSVENLENYLAENLSKYQNKKAVVLGCTHYLAVKEIIQKILPHAEVFDSNEGVANRLKSFVGEGDNIVQFMTSKTGDEGIISRYYQKLLNFF